VVTTTRERRTWPERVLAALLAVFWGLLWFGLVDLLVVVLQDERFHDDYLLESGWGLLYLVLVTVPLVVLVVRPWEAAALQQLAVCAAAVLVGSAWGTDSPQLLTGLGLVATVTLLARRGGRGPWRVGRARGPSRAGLVLAALALAAAVVYGRPLARGGPTGDITNGVSHLPMQASLALAVAGVAGLAALTISRLQAGTAAFAALWLGVESVVYPDLRGSLGALGGACAVVWALLLVAVNASAESGRDKRGVERIRSGSR
jgi:hypothetical protein